jgi:hypothetical protein
VLRVNNDRENIIKSKYDFDDKLKRGERRNKHIVFSPKYTEKRTIYIEKKADLMSLCKSLVVPPIHCQFYSSLTTNQKLKVHLPVHDTLEDDEDSE